MPARSEYAPGTPSWVDLGSPDLDASAEFYGRLLGWETLETGPVEQTGGYRMFTFHGVPVAGLGPLMGEGQPPAWTSYLTTADADATAAKVGEAGGRVLMESLDVLDAGRMAVLADTEGAVFAVWQPGAHRGAGLVNETGALAWNELASRDPEAAKSFYGAVFGWEAETAAMGPVIYTTFKLDGDYIGGMVELGADVPAELPPYWLAYFGVEDCDAATDQLKTMGGVVTVEPMTIPAGRFAVVADPQGAHFAIMDLTAGEG
jgi:predicted enzyme related to lactoylglutathione lyase